MYIYIYIYIERERCICVQDVSDTANLPTNIVDFRGFDSSIISILRDGILRPLGNFPGSLSQAILVGIMLVGRLGIYIYIYIYVNMYICICIRVCVWGSSQEV